MSKQNDGGPAFPTIETVIGPNHTYTAEHLGMSLRQYYAGQAMLGFIASNSTGNISRASVVEADNLLAELRREADRE